MTRFAHFVSSTEVTYPDFGQPPFKGVSNPQNCVPLLRANGYFPLTGEPEPAEGKVAVLDGFALHERTKVVARMVQVEVPDYDPETHEQTGTHTEWREAQVTEDDSSIEVTAWHYEDMPAPAPEPRTVFTRYEVLKALRTFPELYAGLVASYQSDIEINLYWNSVNDIDINNPDCIAIRAQLGITDEMVAAIIAEIERQEQPTEVLA